ncbi:MAG: zf-HC2 domain-containing protein [Acidobacteriota bacterium]
MPATDCVTSEDLNSYLAGRFSESERERAESHLAACRECRHRLKAAVADSRPQPPAAPAPRWLKARALAIGRGERAAARMVFTSPVRYAAAAAMLILAMSAAIIFFRSSEPLPADRLRQQEGLSIAPRLIAPAAGTSVATDRIEFRWAEVQGAESYHLTVMNETGDIVFRAEAEKDHLTVRATDAKLESGKTYFWFVTAKSLDETTADSAIFKFVFIEK